MSRWLVVCAVILSLLGQMFTFAQSFSVSSVLADAEHGALHLEQAAHHHHNDGSVHVDDSLASAQHLLNDHCNTASVLPASAGAQVPSAGPAALPGFALVAVSEPVLDGPLKPPRLTI